MTRVLLISPPRTDADVSRYAEAIAGCPGVSLERRLIARDASLVETLRLGAELYRRRRSIDVVVAVGRAALASASVGWRGRVVHVPVGELTNGDIRLGQRIGRRSSIQIVTSSPFIADRAAEIVDDARLIHVVRPDAAPPTLTRGEARKKLGIDENSPLVHIIGRPRRGSGHRLGLWVTSILHFRDPTCRGTVVAGGEQDGFIQRFTKSSQQTHALIANQHLSPADFAIAADIAICPATGTPDYTALAACRAVGTPIVGLRSIWARERLDNIPATFPVEPRARLFARAVLEAFDRPRPTPAPTNPAESADSTAIWSTILNAPTLAAV